MASSTAWTGFTSGYGLNGPVGSDIIRNPMTAFGGKTFYRYARATAGTLNGSTFRNWSMTGTVSSGQSGVYKVRVVMRVVTAPNGARPIWYAVMGSSVWHNGGVLINADRTIQCFVNLTQNANYTTGSASSPLPLGYADGEGWNTLDITLTATETTLDTLTVSCTITFANGTTQTITHAATPTNYGPNVQNGLYGLNTEPSNTAGFTSSWTGCLDYGQWIQHAATNADVATMPSLPPVGTRHSEVLLTGAGANNAIGYSSGATFRSLNKALPIASSVTTDTRLTTSTAGQQSDFTHDGVLRYGATTTYGLKIIQDAVAGGAPLAQFMVGGVNVAGRGTLASGGQDYTDVTTRSQSVFDALQVGVQSALSSGTYDCRKIQVEVLHDGATGFGAEELNPGAGYRQTWITWTGDGTGVRTLTGAGFRPTAAIVFAPGSSATPRACSYLYPGTLFNCAGAWDTGSWYEFTLDGMLVDGSLNTNTQAYAALLLRDDGTAAFDTSGGGDPVLTGYVFYMAQVSYGNSPSIPTNFGERFHMTPANMLVFPGHNASSATTLMKTPEMGANEAASLNSSSGLDTLRIASFDSNGFTSGSVVTGQVASSYGPLAIAWSTEITLLDLIATRKIPTLGSVVSGIGGLPLDYKTTFEKDASAVRPVLQSYGHTINPAGGTSTSVTGFNIPSGANGYLVAIIDYYNDAGAQTMTCDGVSMSLLWVNTPSPKWTVMYVLANPTPNAAATITSNFTNSVGNRNLAVYYFTGTSGVRWANAHSTGSLLTAEMRNREKDLVVAFFASDALDANSTYTSPGSPWTELWNDGMVGGASVSNWRNSAAGASANTDTASSITWTESGVAGDVYSQVMFSMMPVLPTWNPYLFWVKRDGTNSISPFRMSATVAPAFSGTSCAAWSNQTISITNSIRALGADRAEVYCDGSANAGLKADTAYVWAFAGPGSIEALSPPTTNNDSYETGFEELLTVPAPGVLSNDLSHGAGAMTAVLETDVTHGTLVLNSDGSFTYQPDDDFTGGDSFTYRAWSSEGAGTLATVIIVVENEPVRFDNRGMVGPLAWVIWNDSDDTTHRWSDRPINDAPSPNQYAKERRLIKWGDITARLSDDEGRPAGSAFECTVQDVDRQLRQLMVTESTRYIWGQPLEVWCTTIQARALGQTPQRIFRGRMQQPQRTPNRLAKLRAEDIISSTSDPAIMARDIPRRRLQFQLSDTKQFNNAEPIIYGDVNSVGMPMRGAIQPIYLMDHTISGQLYRLFMVAGHAVKSMQIFYKGDLIPDSCYSDGLIFAPGKPGWPYGTYDPVVDIEVGPTGTTYVEHAGRRYTVIAVRADQINPDDVHFLGVDVQGIENNADGTGVLITNYFEAYYHFLVNFGLQSWQTGDWLDPPLWPDGSDVIEEYWWVLAQDISASRMGDGSGPGYQVRAVIGANGQAASLQDWLRRWNVSGDCRLTVWDGRMQIHMPDRLATITDSIHEDVDLIDDPPAFSSDDSQFTTHYDLHGLPHFNMHRIEQNKWVQQQPSVVCVLSGRAVTNKNYPLVNPAERSYWMSDYDSALNAAEEWLWRRRHPAVMAEFKMSFKGIYYPPGTYFNFTHREGEDDLVTEPYIVESWKLSIEDAVVTITARLHQAGAMTDPVEIVAGTIDEHDSSLGTANDFPPPSWET